MRVKGLPRMLPNRARTCARVASSITPRHYRRHCFSQGTPSLFPSIFVPGQCCRKYVASAQKLICEQ